MTEYVVSEVYGSNERERIYIFSGDRIIRVTTSAKERFQSLSLLFRSVFLPQGYPGSVSSDYMEYQLWDTIQAFSSSITGSLATQAVLKGVGVGDDSATVAAATFTWLLKDGTGMLGRIIFAWLRGSYLDCDCKKWRMFADVLNDIAIFLDILAPYFTNFFRLLVCIAGIMRAVVGVAGGATRAAITQHQARRSNLADVSAKDGSQETLVNLMGLICSLLIIPLLSGKTILVWIFFFTFTTIHLIANYRAVTCIAMEIFNQSRLHIAASKFFTTNLCPDVMEANIVEPILWNMKRIFTIHLGCSLQDGFHLKRAGPFCNGGLVKTKSYLLAFDIQRRKVNIALHVESSMIDQLKSCFHAELIEFCFKSSKQRMECPSTLCQSSLSNLKSLISEGNIQDFIIASQNYVEDNWGRFVALAKDSGWKISPVLLGANEWRIKY